MAQGIRRHRGKIGQDTARRVRNDGAHPRARPADPAHVARTLVVALGSDRGPALKAALEARGHVIDLAPTIGDAAVALARFHPQLLIVVARDHTAAPAGDGAAWDDYGLDLVRWLRRQPDGGRVAALVVLAAHGPDAALRAFDAGADDCVSAPVPTEELVARAAACLRRVWAPPREALRYAGLTLDVSRRAVQRGGRCEPLTTQEFRLLELFFRHPEQVLSRGLIAHTLWGGESAATGRAIGVYVRRIRRKIEAPDEAPLIAWVPRLGYVLRASAAEVRASRSYCSSSP